MMDGAAGNSAADTHESWRYALPAEVFGRPGDIGRAHRRRRGALAVPREVRARPGHAKAVRIPCAGHVAAAGFARVAKAHGNDCNVGRIMQFGVRKASPVAQAIAAGIVPGHAAGVHFAARSLADNGEPRCRRKLYHRSRTMRKMRGTGPASADFAMQWRHSPSAASTISASSSQRLSAASFSALAVSSAPVSRSNWSGWRV